MNIRKHFYSISLLLLAFGSTATVSQSAYARKAAPVSPPQIDNFYVTPVNQFTPGTDLTFTVEGTARGKASVRIGGVARTIPLQEIDRGIYEGEYTVSSRDRISANSLMRATLMVRGRSNVVSQTVSGGAAPAAPASTAAAAPPTGALAIQRFIVTPINKIEPGADLKFTLTGTPGVKALFTIEGVTKDAPMQEVKSGQYEGSYTIRRLDHFPSNVNVTGTLEANGQAVRSRLNQALIADAKPPVIKNMAPRENETVSGNPILISGTFDDAGGVGVDTKSVRILLAGNDITSNATVTPQFFSYRADLRPGTYPVEVNAKDLSGNAVRRNWKFTVAAQPAPAATVLPLQILSHANNAQVGNGSVEVRGRTAPDAKVDVQVQAITQIAGYFGLNQQIYNQSLRADANGNFAFTFQPQIPVPGARYEITINASKADLSKEMKLVLFQQK